MTLNTQKLADDIAKVMELDKKRTPGETPPHEWFVDDGSEVLAVGDEVNYGVCKTYGAEDAQFIASAPLMADIIRRQQELIGELARALRGSDELIEKAQAIMASNITPHGISDKDAIRDYIALLDNVYQRDVMRQTANALTLATPLLEKEPTE